MLLTLAGEGDIRLYTSRLLLTELRATLAKPKLAKAIAAIDRAPSEIVADYRRLCTLVRPAPLPQPLSRDPDDDHVIACALGANADFLVTGDDDLLSLAQVEGVSIKTVTVLMETLG